MVGTVAATVATGVGALFFGLACNESLNETGLEGSLCDIADGVAVTSVLLAITAPLTVWSQSRRGHGSRRLFTVLCLAFVGWGALLLVAAVMVG